jgi:RHS repeat-associated protein
MNTALEQRTAKYGPTSVVPTGFAYYAYDEAGHLLGEYDSTGIPLYEVAWLGDQPLAVIKQTRTGSGTTLNVATGVDYMYADHLNTPRVIVRSTDHVPYWRWDNSAEPFGAVAPNNNPNALGAYTFNLRFPGQTFDSETGMFYNMQRDYVAQWGRYTQSDPIGLAGGINTYLYVGGNPLSYTDPQGLFVPLVVYAVVETAPVWAPYLAYGTATLATAAATYLTLSPPPAAPDYSPWSPNPEVNKEFVRDRDTVNDVKPAPYRNPLKPTCDENRDRIMFLEDIVAQRRGFTNKWYGGALNSGHAGRIETLLKDIERLRARLARGDCEC